MKKYHCCVNNKFISIRCHPGFLVRKNGLKEKVKSVVHLLVSRKNITMEKLMFNEKLNSGVIKGTGEILLDYGKKLVNTRKSKKKNQSI